MKSIWRVSAFATKAGVRRFRCKSDVFSRLLMLYLDFLEMWEAAGVIPRRKAPPARSDAPVADITNSGDASIDHTLSTQHLGDAMSSVT